ncbi:glycosyltransferase family 2 protein [Terrisporobacter mayombei]|uniref:Glycosyltransferase EpsJ n=1 Tax=Terrisporobacter mayombei TaxID=1541 RepID=A0ABY9Q337_9FIRM|nr:glycosyltransferase family 2 protein [Terrisporobacter mayombei]MCC3867213.1 glycosyltransferase [Terrisporobacter mayombei]WMT81475.1 putative glycosyltransferase EpsJ [Terrisporobacter mayombei]
MYKVSVIVPIYNAEENLNRCLDSIRNQTYTNMEIILVDSGSTDNSKKIAIGYVRFDKRIRLLNMERSKLCEAINYATEYATGQYMLYVDSKDSWLDKNMISLMVEKQEKYKSDAIQVDSYDVYFDKLLYDDKYIEEDGEGLILDNKYLMEELNINERVKNVIWGKLYKTDLIKKMILENEEKTNELQWIYEVMNIIERYIILHKPVIYNIKEN